MIHVKHEASVYAKLHIIYVMAVQEMSFKDIFYLKVLRTFWSVLTFGHFGRGPYAKLYIIYVMAVQEMSFKDIFYLKVLRTFWSALTFGHFGRGPYAVLTTSTEIILGTRKCGPCQERVFIYFELQEAIEVVIQLDLWKKDHSRIITQ